MKYRVGARTDVGRVRQGNEDGFTIRDSLFAVADGMGGHQGGEVASRIALDTIEEADGSGDVVEHLSDVVKRANDDVLAAASRDPQLAGMGTTLTVAVVQDDEIHVAHVGDSRAYLLRDGSLQQITVDHTVVQRLVEEGRITREEADIHPQRSILTRALGVDDDVTVDEAIIQAKPGDRFLLCSDGLTGMVSEAEIQRILSDVDDPQRASETLVDAANDAGGQDNITAVVIDVLEGSGSEVVAPPQREARRERRGGGPAVWSETRRKWPRRVLLWAVLPIIVIGAALFAGKWWVDRQWFVGVSPTGNVAIFRGIPAQPLGLDLSTLHHESGLPAADVQRFPEYESVGDGITATSEEDAKAIIDAMRQALKDAEEPTPVDGGTGDAGDAGGGGNGGTP